MTMILNWALGIDRRLQRIERMQMKKQAAQKKPKVKKAAKPAEVAWHVRAQGLPLALFHTTVGPIIGRVEKVDDPGVGVFNLRLWAPAALRMVFEPGQPGVTALNSRHMVTFQPMALIETYLDLSSATPFGRSPVPDALIPSYDQYFEKVVFGEYAFTRVVAHVHQAAPHEAPIAAQAEDAPIAQGSVPADPDVVDATLQESENDKADDESTLS